MEDELYHYGVKGMKWGVRRTAEQLGHVVKAGAKKVKATVETSVEKSKAKKHTVKANDKKIQSKPKSIKDMTDDELKALQNRLQLEKNVLTLQADVKRLTPQQITKGKAVVNSIKKTTTKIANEAIVPSLTNLTKTYLTEIGKKKLGLDNADPMKALENEVKELRLKSSKMKFEDEINSRTEKRKEQADSSTKSDASTNANTSTKSKAKSTVTNEDISRGEEYLNNSDLRNVSIAGLLPAPEKKRKK